MEIVAEIDCELHQVAGKVEQDESFANKSRDTEESGVFSQDNSSNKSHSRGSNNWECYKDEVFDSSIFSLPEYVQSSNLNGVRPSAEFSSILESINGGQGLSLRKLANANS